MPEVYDQDAEPVLNKEEVGDSEISLLAEWYDWWYNTEEAPVKMPNALHVRTAIRLTELGILDAAQRART